MHGGRGLSVCMTGTVSLQHGGRGLSVCMTGHGQSACSVCMFSLDVQWVWTIAAYYWSGDPCPTLCYAVALRLIPRQHLQYD